MNIFLSGDLMLGGTPSTLIFVCFCGPCLPDRVYCIHINATGSTEMVQLHHLHKVEGMFCESDVRPERVREEIDLEMILNNGRI